MSEQETAKAGSGRFDPGVLAIAIGLFGLAALVAYDASTIRLTQVYATVGPKAAPFMVAGGLALFGALTTIAAFSGAFARREPEHWGPVAWIGGGLAFQIMALTSGLGFILATAVLFATTSRAFGRRALPQDLGIGLVLGTGVYVMFTKLLTLSLPQGPLERLF
jgi:putative tricarboxylic transport membrane protein